MKLFLLPILFTTLVFNKLVNGQQHRVADGVSICSSSQSWSKSPNALDIAEFTVEYMMNQIQLEPVKTALTGLKSHFVWLFHCDPSGKTGLYNDLEPKNNNDYDYVTDYYDDGGVLANGHSPDEILGFGGTPGTPGTAATEGTAAIPATTGRYTLICDCNILGIQCPQNRQQDESILVHEFGHAIMDIGIFLGDNTLYQYINDFVFVEYKKYVTDFGDPADLNAYSVSNAQEMWALSIQAWFIGTARTDYNPGISTPLLMSQNVPSLFDTLYQVFGLPPRYTIIALDDINTISERDWTYYNYNIPLYGDESIKSKWTKLNTPSPTEVPTNSPTFTNVPQP